MFWEIKRKFWTLLPTYLAFLFCGTLVQLSKENLCCPRMSIRNPFGWHVPVPNFWTRIFQSPQKFPIRTKKSRRDSSRCPKVLSHALTTRRRYIAVHWTKKCSHFDLKSWVTGGTKIRLGILSKWRIFESNWKFDSQYRVNFTQIFCNYSESQVEFYFPQWLNFLGQNDSTFWVKMTTFFLSV